MRSSVLSPDASPTHTTLVGFRAALLRAVDELHDHADLTDAIWSVLSQILGDHQVLELSLLAGSYPEISVAAYGVRILVKGGAARFAD